MKFHIAKATLSFIAVALASQTAIAIEGKNCRDEKQLKVVAQESGSQQWVEYEDYRVDIGGPEESYSREIDKEMVRRNMLECMSGTIRCLRENKQAASHGKIIVSSKLRNLNRTYPEISELKVELVGLGDASLKTCLENYWSDVRYPQHSVEAKSAWIKVPLNIKKLQVKN